MSELLAGHDALIAEFAGFLYPEQAREVGFLAEQQDWFRARLFIRKLEVRLPPVIHELDQSLVKSDISVI